MGGSVSLSVLLSVSLRESRESENLCASTLSSSIGLLRLLILILYFEHQHDFFISCKKEEEENGTWKCIPFAF